MKHRKQHVFKSAVLPLKHVPTMVAVKKLLLLSCYHADSIGDAHTRYGCVRITLIQLLYSGMLSQMSSFINQLRKNSQQLLLSVVGKSTLYKVLGC